MEFSFQTSCTGIISTSGCAVGAVASIAQQEVRDKRDVSLPVTLTICGRNNRTAPSAAQIQYRVYRAASAEGS